MKKLLLSAVLFSVQPGAYAYDKVEFRREVKNVALTKISAITVLGDKLAVADTKANAVYLFDAEGKLYKKSTALLKEPSSISASDSRIYVADKGNSRIVVLDAEGSLLWAFSGSGSLPGQLSNPMGVAYGPDSRVYVSNNGKSTIEVFNSDGIFLYNFPAVKGDGSKAKPGQIVLDRSGFIYVSDPDNALIYKYDRSGKLVKEYNLPNDSVTVDDYGVLYVINSKEGKVREVANTGEVLGVFGTKGKTQMAFAKLKDIAIDANGDVCLADQDNKKVTVMHLEGTKTARLPKAQPMDRFNLKGPVKKYPYKSDVFVVKPDQTVIAYLPELKEVAQLGDAGKKTTLIRSGDKPGQVKAPKGMMVDDKGRIYVSDTGNNRVQIFNADGTFAGSFGESGSEEGNFKSPAGITVNPKGNIYVADSRNKRIQAFSADGMFLFAVGPQLGNITLQNPIGVRVDAGKNLYILDAGLKKVVVTDGAGKFLRIWDDSGNLKDPAGISYDWRSYFYILDRGDFNVKIFDDQGKFVSSFFAKGIGERELKGPQCMSISGNTLYIADYEGAKVLAFELSYMPESPLFDPNAVSADARQVKLGWFPVKTPWLKNYAVYRSEKEVGGFKKLGEVDKTEYADKDLKPDTTYYYAVAGISVTGDPGAKSASLAMYIKGPEKKASAGEGSADLSASAGIEAGGEDDETGPGSKNITPMEILMDEKNPIHIFSANYKYYIDNPIGKVIVKNNTDNDFSNVKLSFRLKEYMDDSTDAIIPELKAKSKVEVLLKPILNNRILTINENTPVNAQFLLAYSLDNDDKGYKRNYAIKILSKNAITWDDAARLGNFITINDTPIQTLRAGLMGDKEKFMDKAEFLNNNIVQALMIWEGLGLLGINYQPDATSPFTAKLDPAAMAATLDTVQFPRDTLALKSGDCDDLTALYAALLKASALNVAIMDFPGHVALMVDSGKKDPWTVGIPKEYLIEYDGTYWVPIEVTMTGKDFYEGMKQLAELYKASGRSKAEGGQVNLITVDAAIKKFAQVTLDEPKEPYQSKLNTAVFAKRVESSIESLAQVRYDSFKNDYGKILLAMPGDVDSNINMGILDAQYNKDATAAEYFNKVLEKDPKNAAALNGLGNLSYKKGKYEDAREYYLKAAKIDNYDANLWLNLARLSAKLGNTEDVKRYVGQASKNDPDLAKKVGAALTK